MSILELKNYPGYNSKEDLWSHDGQKYFKKYTDKFVGFIGVPRTPCYDIGEYNPKVEAISRGYWEITSLDPNGKNFNHDNFEVPGDAETIFCLDILEHLTNPQFFLENITRNMKHGTDLYLSVPGRMKVLWGERHFHEIDPARLKKWLLSPLGLKVIRQSKIQTYHPVSFYFTGIRPVLRFFFNHTHVYQIRKEK